MLKLIKDCPALQEERLRVAAVCVYPSRVSDAVKIIDGVMEISNGTDKKDSIQVASGRRLFVVISLVNKMNDG